MTTPHRTLQMALDALDAITDDVDGTGLNTMPSFDGAIDAIAALREALAADHLRDVAEKVAPAAPVVPLTDARKLCTCDGAGRGPGRACVVQAGGRLGDLWKCAKSAAPAVREPLTREQQIAIREAQCNTASDEYFGARPHIDSREDRRIYEAGFKEGWESGIGGGGNG
jgi:hypothetical protein